MKTKNIFAALSLFGLLIVSSPFATAMGGDFDIRAAIRTATTQRDHETVAKYYEDAATELQAKVYEKRELLEHYQDKSYLYGRRAQDLQAHTDALLRNYERTMKVSMQEGAAHRQMALILEENNRSMSDPQRLSAVSKSHHSSAPGIIVVD